MSYCNWKNSSPENCSYHDNEWGIPIYDDTKHFEALSLEALQCGLNWNIIIKKRPIFRKCFENFHFDKVAKFTAQDINKILQTDGMIKSPQKIKAIINNAKCFQALRNEFGHFNNYIWSFSAHKTIIYNNHPQGNIPTINTFSEKISKDLKKRGFKYLGAISIYSYLQACGIINDHDQNCPRFHFINEHYPTIFLPNDDDKQIQNFR